ncbi:Homoserine kinase [Anatilimnocola aggregata]|uniref:Homoserine kinase n=1 Tax=Anatilimnocola aggregata TaxID=2528021 RepID=A0A517YLT9_9BACT|nr:phosphotransferase [Anatilimnocola aggregata]QDU31174.1 Homoserine kinase [Anatilimnocola aggregata]
MPRMDDSAALTALSIFRGSATKFQLQRLGREGFSGSSVWRVTAPDAESLCLKRWPASHPSPARLPWIHHVLQHARGQGMTFLPEPQITPQGATICDVAGSTWELMTWLPGSADYQQNPSPARLRSAFRTLALFHHATSVFATAYMSQASFARTTPALDERIARWKELQGQIGEISAAVQARPIPAIDDLAQQWLARKSTLPPNDLQQLRAANQLKPFLQPVVRDLWSDHVLFTGDEVTGFIDFGAMRPDTRLTDIARLIGSLAGDNLAERTAALSAYAEIRPLSARERQLVDLLDRTGTLLAGWNWLDWLYVEQREFTSLPAVRGRLTHLLQRIT